MLSRLRTTLLSVHCLFNKVSLRTYVNSRASISTVIFAVNDQFEHKANAFLKPKFTVLQPRLKHEVIISAKIWDMLNKAKPSVNSGGGRKPPSGNRTAERDHKIP